MAKLRLNKLEAARRQVAEAIRMYFCDRDPVVCHTVACAGAQVISDLLHKKSGFGILRRSSFIREDKQAEVNATIKASENFFKHADRDPKATHIFETETTPAILFAAICEYQLLAGSSFPEADLFGHWYILQHPSIVDEPYRSQMLETDAKLGLSSASRGELCEVLERLWTGSSASESTTC